MSQSTNWQCCLRVCGCLVVGRFVAVTYRQQECLSDISVVVPYLKQCRLLYVFAASAYTGCSIARGGAYLCYLKALCRLLLTFVGDVSGSSILRAFRVPCSFSRKT
jgi:hypothetical protein